MATLADLTLEQFERENSETGTSQFNQMGYNAALGQLGYIPTSTKLGLWKSPETLQYFNQTYGTNFTDPVQYLNWVTGGQGTMVNDPVHGELYKLPEGSTYGNWANAPLSYEKSDWFDTVIPGIIGGVAMAGMGGMLPGTESIFGGASGAGGVYGGEIAGTSAAGEGIGAASGFSFSDPSTWLSPDAPWGVNPQGGDLPAGYFDDFIPGTFDGPTGGLGDYFDDFVPGTFDGPGSAVVGDIAGITPSAGVPSGSILNNLLTWAQQNPQLAGQLLGSGVNALSSYFSSQAQQNAANQANQTLWNMYQQNRTDLAPWRTAGVGALGQLVDLTTPGKQLDTAMLDPGYAFRQAEGQRALDAAAKAGGRFYSGRQLKDTAEYNQNFATNEFGNVYNRLAGLAGTGQTATTQTGQFGQNTATGMASNQVGAGNARASGYMGIGNAVSGGIGGYLNTMNQQNLLNQILGYGR